MCGVIGLVYENEKSNLGSVGGKLLTMLEYRGYDSTGALLQDKKGKTVLKKDVGAPSKLIHDLKIVEEKGNVFCGQVRWATFGAVTKANAQPHEVRCKIHFYGAHNGNITNCEQLKEWLKSEGHDIKSDNDGEMLVHTVEHFFAKLLKESKAKSPEDRKIAFTKATVEASKKLVGSYAAIVFDPETRVMIAIKAGSSLYIGLGHNHDDGNFVIASSDLGSVLSLTKILLPLSENEFIVSTHAGADVFHLRTGEHLERQPKRTTLNAFDTQLQPPYKYFMEQEIHAQAETTAKLIKLYTGTSPEFDFIRHLKSTKPDIFSTVSEISEAAVNATTSKEIAELCTKILNHPTLEEMSHLAKESKLNLKSNAAFSSYMSSFLEELRKGVKVKNSDKQLLPKLLDISFELFESEEIQQKLSLFVNELIKSISSGNNIYILACGSSFHAAKSGTMFFNEIAGIETLPLLPGEFRAQCSHALRDGDVIIGISQSGETKDLIDIFNQIAESGKNIPILSLVNNTNSTLAQEKSKVCLPLLCGPEIAVAATKSFMNQITLLYLLSIKLMTGLHEHCQRRFEESHKQKALSNLFRIPDLLNETLRSVKKPIEQISENLFLEPSIHILATRLFGNALEGSLKIREVVLNHTQGYEGSEFKHGPNSILGINTIFGLDSVRAILKKFSTAVMAGLKTNEGKSLSANSIHKLFSAVSDFAFDDIKPKSLTKPELTIFKHIFEDHNFFESMYRNYPLLFLTGPSERDVNLTISQINTHKIRGANVFAIAEDNPLIKKAVEAKPATGLEYKFGYVKLPTSGDDLLPIFSSTVVLQLLALSMSIKKMTLLDRLDIKNHGVHPDAPKNVSKSITVD